MAPILVRPALRLRAVARRRTAAPRKTPPAVRRAPPVRPPAAPRRVAAPAVIRPPVARAAAPSAPHPAAADWQGPNPYVGFARRFTDAGGIRLSFFVQDERVWERWLRTALWLLAMAATLWFAAKASPFPLVPRGCPLLGPCPVPVPPLQYGANVAFLAAMALLFAWVLFGDGQRLASVEIRPDCMIVDDTDVFWQRHMDLGWPGLAYDSDVEATVLRGVYGTRSVRYLILPQSDDANDRTTQVIAWHLQFAMKQLWPQPPADK